MRMIRKHHGIHVHEGKATLTDKSLTQQLITIREMPVKNSSGSEERWQVGLGVKVLVRR